MRRAAIYLVGVSVALAGNPIKTFDDFIVCFGVPPPPNAGWPGPPNVRARAWYENNNELCSQAYGLQYHLGCACPGPDQEPECLLEHGADPVLYDAPLDFEASFGYHWFLHWCESNCSCMSENTALFFHQHTTQEQQDMIDQAEANMTDPFPYLQDELSGSSGEGIAFPGNVGGSGSPSSFSSSASCGGTCEAATACGQSGCICQVAGASSYVPRLGTFVYTALCSVDLGKKRDEALPCPCNSTYVSHGCCDAENGLIWEAPGLKLGELQQADL